MTTLLDSDNYWNKTSQNAFSFDENNKDEEYEICNENSNFVENSHYERNINSFIKSFIPKDCLSLILSEQTLESEILPKVKLLESELKLVHPILQKYLLTPSLKLILRQVLMGKFSQIQDFRSFYEKELLLDLLVERGGGDNIIGAIIFINKTLNKEQTRSILISRSKAVEQCVNYFIHFKNQAAILILGDLCQTKDSLFLDIKQTEVECKNLPSKTEKVVQFLDSKKSNDLQPSVYYNMMECHYNLLKSFKEYFSLDISIFDYSCTEYLYVYNKIENSLEEIKLLANTKSLTLCENFSVSSSHLYWTIFNERCALQRFTGLEKLFEKPSWHLINQKHIQVNFSIERALLRLLDWHAPIFLFQIFSKKLNDPIKELKIIQKFKKYDLNKKLPSRKY